MNSTRDKWAEMLAALMKAPMTVDGLKEYTGMDEGSVLRVLTSLRTAGLVYSPGKETSEKAKFRKPNLWRLQPSPFHYPEFPPKTPEKARVPRVDKPPSRTAADRMAATKEGVRNMVAKGMKTTDIAREMNINRTTVWLVKKQLEKENRNEASV